MRTQRIGTRLTVSFGVAFLVAGFLLLAVNYTLVQRQLDLDGRADTVDRLSDLGITFDADFLDQLPEGFDPEQLDRGEFDPSALRPFADLPVTEDGRTFTEVLAEVEQSVRSETLNTLLIQGAIAILVVGAVAVPVGWWLSTRALRPVAEISQTAHSLSEDDLSARVGLTGPQDELKELADTFDAMLDRLERGYTNYRNFAGVASHELRTPLTAMRVEADNAIDDPKTSPDHRLMAERVRNAVDASERMIDQLMALTRSSAGLTHATSVDLTEITGEVVGDLSRLATSHGVRLDLDLGDAHAVGDATLLRVLVTNLVDNAIVHNVAGGWATVAVEAEGERSRLTVANGGHRYSTEDVARMLEPFERIADERTRGSGLGLATAGAIVGAHGGELHADPIEDGGLAVTVTLPARTTSSALQSDRSR